MRSKKTFKRKGIKNGEIDPCCTDSDVLRGLDRSDHRLGGMPPGRGAIVEHLPGATERGDDVAHAADLRADAGIELLEAAEPEKRASSVRPELIQPRFHSAAFPS